MNDLRRRLAVFLGLLPSSQVGLAIVKNAVFFSFLFIQGIVPEMRTKYHMEGSVNGHEFTIEGVGTGNPYE